MTKQSINLADKLPLNLVHKIHQSIQAKKEEQTNKPA